jgi:AhpD family alkylhydroperoxidase
MLKTFGIVFLCRRSMGRIQMSRVAMIERPHAPLLARRFYDGGDPGAIVASLAHVPELLEVANPFIGVVLGRSALAPRLKEIIVLRTSSLLQCRYCTDAHTVVAMDSGVSLDEVLALRGELPLDTVFSDARERALIDWVECIARGIGEVPEAVAAELGSHFSDAEVVEITLVATTTMMLNRYCTALALSSSPETLARLTEEGLR